MERKETKKDAVVERLETHKSDPVSAGDAFKKVSRMKNLDTHELLKKEVFESLAAGDDNHFEKNRPGPESIVGVSDHYIVLDTFEKDPVGSNPSKGIYRWNFMVEGETRNQMIGTRYKIETVIEIVIGNFAVPIFRKEPYVVNPLGEDKNLPILLPNDTEPSGGALDSTLSQAPFGSFVTMQLKEVGQQKFSDRGGGHHFPLIASVNLPGGLVLNNDPLFVNQTLFFTPVAGWDGYIFTDPIKDVHGLTIQFKNPDIPIDFPPDVFYDVFMQITADNTVEFVVPGHGLEYNDRIYITGVSTGDSIFDNYINGKYSTFTLPYSGNHGRLVGDDAKNTVNTFRLNPDVGSPIAGAPGDPIPSKTPITIYVAKRRMRIPMRLRGVVKRLTQYMGP